MRILLVILSFVALFITGCEKSEPKTAISKVTLCVGKDSSSVLGESTETIPTKEATASYKVVAAWKSALNENSLQLTTTVATDPRKPLTIVVNGAGCTASSRNIGPVEITITRLPQ